MKNWLTSVLLFIGLQLSAQTNWQDLAVNDRPGFLFSANNEFSPRNNEDFLFGTTAVTGDYRSKQSGDWSAASTWERYNGSAWVAATVAPTNTDGAINIQNTHTVTVTTAVTADEVTVDAGGILTISAAFSLSDGTGDDLTINGTVNLSAGSVGNSGGGTNTITNNGTVNWSGGNWTTINTFNNSTGATFNISGTASQLSDGSFINYGTINWSAATLTLSTYVITNNSDFNITGNNSMVAGVCGGSPCSVTFNNYGIIYKSSAGTTDLLLSSNTGTVKGTGTINFSALTSKGGIIAPGNGDPGLLILNGGTIFNNFTSSPSFIPASNFNVEIKDASGAGTGHDQVKRAGNLVLGGILNVSEAAGTPSGTYVIVSLTSGTISGTFSSINIPPGYIYNSNSTSVTLQKGTCGTPVTNNTITAPAVTNFCGSGDPAVITGSTATGGSGVMNYQWQQQIGTDIYRDISGATATSYDPPLLTQTTNYRRLAFTGSCSNYSSVVTITITGGSTSAPTITAGGVTTFCSGGSVTLSSSSATGNQWYNNGVQIIGATNQTYIATSGGNYTCTYTLSGCTSPASNTISVTVNAIPSAPTITAGGATTFCSGGSVTLSSSVVSGNQWYKDGNIIAGATNQTYAATASGTYTSIVTSSGCSSVASNSIVVTVNPIPSAPTITAGGATTFCSGGSVTLSSSVVSGNQWYKDGSIIAGATNQTYAASTSGSYTCVVTSNGCSSTISNSIVVTVNPIPSAPTITAGGATTFCSGGSVTLSSSVVSGNQWYKDGSIIAGATNQTYAVTTSGSYSCIVTSSSCSSVASNSIVVTVNPVPSAPTITAGGATTFCSGGSVTLNSSVVSGNQWYKDGNIIAGATNQTYITSTSGTYTSKVTTSGCTSISSNSIVVTVNPVPSAPTITAGGATTFCSGGSVTLSSSVISGNQWYKDGNIIAGATNQTYITSTSGTYTSKVTTSGCTSIASNSIIVTVNPIPTAPTITAGGAITFCSGGGVTLSSSFVIGNQWYKDGSIIVGATNQTYAVTASGTYTSIVTSSGCSSVASNSIVVTVNPVPSAPTITAGGATTFCSGGSVTLSSSVVSGNQWYKDGNIIAGATNQTYAATVSGTYTCIVTSSGCSSVASNTIVVTVNPIPSAPTITAGGTTTFCSGGSITLSSSVISGNQWYKDGNIIAGATNQTYAASTSGSYTCIVTSSGCSSVASNAIAVTVNPVPSAPTITAGGATTFCSGGSVTLSSSVVSGNQWYKDGSIIAGATNQTYAVTTSGSYSCIVTSSSCSSVASNSIVVTVNPVPSAPTITAGGATTFCSGGSVTLSSSFVSGNQWYKDGSIIAGATNQTYATSTSGSYTCVVTSNGCSSAISNSIVVTVNPIPSAPTITAGSATTFCSGGSVTLSSSVVSGNQWYKDGNIIAGATNQTYVTTASGTYTCIVTSSGCSSVASNAIVVTVNPIPSAPTITAGGATTFCSGGSVTLSSSVVSGNQWYKDGNIIAGATNQTYVATTSGTYTCIVTSSGCSSVASNAIVVTVNPIPSAPTITAGGATTFCSGGSVTLSSSVVSGNQWYKDGSIIGGATNQTYVATTSGTYTCIVTSSGCSSVASNAIAVTVNPVPSAPTITAGGATTFCSGGSVTLSSSIISGNQWYKDGNIIAGATNQTYVTSTSGTYTSKVTTSGCTSIASNSIIVTVNPIPTAPTITAGGATTFCSGGSVTLSSSAVSGNQWYKDGNIIAGATNQTYAVTTSGSYTSKITSSGCTSTASNSIVVTVNPIPSAPTITAGGATTFCNGGSVTLSSSVVSGNQWYKDGNIIAGATNQTYAATISGTYTCIITSSGCSSTISNSIVVTVNPIPSAPTITAGGATTFCSGGSVTLSSSVVSGNQWYKDGSIIAGATNQTYTATASGTYTSKVTTSGCISSASNAIVVTVNSLPSKPVITLVSNNLQSSALTGNQWYKEGVLIAGAINQTYSPTVNGNYTVIVTVNGCSSLVSDAFNFLSTAIPEITFSEKIKIFPNPVLTDLVIVTKTSIIQQTIKLFDVNGKQLLLINNSSPSLRINMEQLASGLYLLWIEDRKNKITGKLKIVKQ